MIDIFEKHGLRIARMLGWSKSRYREENPDHVVVFNANVFTESSGKVWHGDLDLTKDGDVLKSISKEIGESLYVLYEMDGRFGNENLKFDLVEEKAIGKF
jgi:hypothetical protein